MKRIIAVALCAATVTVSGCTTRYSGMTKEQRMVAFEKECRAAGHAAGMITYCALDMEQQFLQQRDRDVAVGVAAVAIGAAAIAIAANSGGGYYSQPTYRGNCQYDWQYDAAGNKCGRRSAQSRPGGW
ncbi:hypothetical protein [Rhizobium sp. SL42]|uniref:hypothetical protein n=1 Tax=Rhizobium sp. SL42 TaxID=2806346 RepID=UPI001F490AFE|nr:hypothetical protein [Rhizobium sp. SL42]UJW77827.1 hypothetical protein IM739_22375 [Rhizobium sp. SL42]